MQNVRAHPGDIAANDERVRMLGSLKNRCPCAQSIHDAREGDLLATRVPRATPGKMIFLPYAPAG